MQGVPLGFFAMRRLPLLAPLLLTVSLWGAGCSQTAPGGGTPGATAARANELPGALTPALPAARAAAGFATLADHGDLLGYPTQPVVRHEDASTWYRADVSEAHALRAIVTGRMTITAPDGQPIHLSYQRHVEHPNGNWTWIGRDERGREAILTFGEKAVFGSLPQTGTHELRLATIDGHSWVVDVDLSRQPEPKRADYLVPPKLAASLAAADAPLPTSQADIPVAAAATAATTVDLALGYTTTYASELGGDSQAVTRLQNLVDITNQAYSNSQINAQIRLVKTVAVNFPDATDNDDALSKLSGYKAPSGTVPIDPALTGLRAARDQYGADLVSLVRRFRTPENKGCGVAWLIGGDLSGIDTSDSPWGYSVVSDDLDKGDKNETDNKTYVCRKETLAHELGHNMGQQHNTEDAGGSPGAHTYSYGYRETSTTGFYTVMAYRLPDGNQTAIRYFANPNVQDAVTHRVTGVANASDNARSMAITMPLIANFRATVVVTPPTQPPASARGLAGDIDADGKDDVLWFNPQTRELYYWLMDGGAVRLGRGGVLAPANTTPRALADVNNDGRADILLPSGQDIWIYLGNASGTFTSAYLASYPAGWDLVGMADVDADGKADVVWHNPTTRELYYWLLDGATIRLGRGGVTTPPGTVPRLGDLNGDHRVDVVLPSTGDIWVYLGNSGGTFTSSYIASYPAGWEMAGAQDVDADGKDDLMWFNPSSGELYYWLMNGGAIRLGRGGVLAPTGATPRIVADFSGDNRADVFLPNGSNIWTYVGNASGTFTSFYTSPYPAGWQ